MTRITVPHLTPRQRELIASSQRLLHVATATKTGKTTALAVWVVQGLLAGERTCWVAPWYPRARAAFETIRAMLAPLERSGRVRANEGLLRLRATAGGCLDCFSGDNFQGIFGGNFDRVVIDEASRCPAGAWPAVLTTVSATNGRVRAAFNVELGSRNWAVRNFLRVRALSPEERAGSGEGCITFTTLEGGLVDPALIEALKKQMPLPLWEALYLAKIPESDVALFRNLDELFTGQELTQPSPGSAYVAGVDLARKTDWTVVTILDARTGAVVAMDRFHEISWSLQYERVKSLYETFSCTRAVVDASGLGDVAVEELQKLGLRVEPFIFTQPSRKALIENLIVACDQREVTLPATEKFQAYRQELASFEYVLDGREVRYAAPPGQHDDCVMSLALALRGKRPGLAQRLTFIGRERPANPEAVGEPAPPGEPRGPGGEAP